MKRPNREQRLADRDGRNDASSSQANQQDMKSQRTASVISCQARAALLALVLVVGLTSSVLARRSAPPQVPPPVPVMQSALKAESGGTFTDSAGKAHTWRISQGHMLYWDDQPYIPVGGAFMPHSWVDGNNDSNWELDKSALDTLKKHHVVDLILTAGNYGLLHVHSDAIQKVLDYLDANGFRYGIEIADFPKDPLSGYVVRPSVYRNPSLPDNGPARFSHIPGLLDAFFMLVSTRDGSVDASGDAIIENQETASVSVSHDSDDVLLLYPNRIFEAGSPESKLPDVWQDYDDYRDDVISAFSHIKLGPGFRFFIDPLSDRIAMNGEILNFVPTSDDYHLQFEAWLNSRYKGNVDDLNEAWGIEERDLPDFDSAARCIPLWYESKGLASIIDLKTRIRYGVINKPSIRSSVWDDINDFRTDSVRGAMNGMADVLKSGVADVPVLYRWTQRNPIFTNTESGSGFDGLGFEAYGHGTDLTVKSGALALAQTEESVKTEWLIAGSTMETSELDTKSDPGYDSKSTLFSDWDGLKNLETRGFYTSALQLLPEERYSNVNLVGLPDQLDWLSSYEATVQAGSDMLAQQQLPILWYPDMASGIGANVEEFNNGVWWLPSFRGGETLKMGRLIRGYRIGSQYGQLSPYVIWSPEDRLSSARFGIGMVSKLAAFDTGGNLLPVLLKKGIVTVPVGSDPIQLTGVDALPLSLDVIDEMTDGINRLFKLADTQKVDVQHLKEQFEYATVSGPNTSDQVTLEYDQLQRVQDALTEVLRPYAWMEGENATPDTFDAIVPDTGASGGAYLSLDTDRIPPRDSVSRVGGYRAEFSFTVNAAGHYEIWMAGSPLDTEAASSFDVSADGDPPLHVHGVSGTGGTYGPGFVWSDLGQVTLQSGRHTLLVLVTGTRPADDRYALDIDSLLVTRAPFTPDGTNRPPIETLALDGGQIAGTGEPPAAYGPSPPGKLHP